MGKIKVNYTDGSFAVYNSFVDNFIKEANPSYIKVYLYVLRHANAGNSIFLGKMASELGLIKSDVISALEYWDAHGLIGYNNDADNICLEIKPCASVNVKPEPVYTENDKKTDSDDDEKRFLQPNDSVASSYKTNVVARAINEDKKLSHLFSLIQHMLSKNLSSNDYKIIYSFIDYLKLPEQVIIILFEYCISIKKTNMRYIEKLAYTWADSGITTSEKAEEYVKYKEQQDSVQSYYKQKFKISGRDFTDTEIKYLLTWLNDYKVSEEEILSAFEKTVMNIGKVSFKYMDTILKDGASAGGNTGGGSKFKNYPDKYQISSTEKERIKKMLAEFEGGED